MSPFETVRIAGRALLRNKTRSVMTALGIIIGVGAVIAMMAIGEGAKKVIEDQFAAMGTNLLVVQSGSATQGGVRGGAASGSSLTWDDLEAIRTQVPTVAAAAPSLRANASVISEEQNWSTSVHGTTPDYFDIRSWPIEIGRAISTSDVESALKVVVLGATTAARLYGSGADAIGRVVRIRTFPYQVIGVAAVKGQSLQGQDFDDTVFIPVTTFQQRMQKGLKSYLSGSILVAAASPDVMTTTETDVTNLLRDRHRIRDGAEDDFTVRNLAEIASAEQEGAETMATFLASVAAVSLLVGGIGIMNIMLVSVTERTREIGVRMALGAKPRDILAQFLAEALALSAAGGALGVGVGLYAAMRLAEEFEWPVVFRGDMIAVAVVFSAFVGILFGLYPARKASRLDPIDALRYE